MNYELKIKNVGIEQSSIFGIYILMPKATFIFNS